MKEKSGFDYSFCFDHCKAMIKNNSTLAGHGVTHQQSQHSGEVQAGGLQIQAQLSNLVKICLKIKK